MKLILPFRALSVNNMYYANRQHGLKTSAKEWLYQVNWELAKYAKEFMELRQSFDPKKHGISIEFTFYYKDFYNSTGTVSSKCFDLSNVEKPLQDALLNPSNHGSPPYKTHNLALDDKFVVDSVSHKRPADLDSVEILITVVELPVK